MKWTKLTAFSSFFVAVIFCMSSCEKSTEVRRVTTYNKSNIVLSGAQETPATTSAAIGKMDVSYSTSTKTLSYKVSWSGLTGPVAAMHIHASAPSGYAAVVLQNIITSSGGIVVPNATLYGTSGSFSGTLYVDGIAVSEQALLSGLFYMNIHTAAYPGGEIRGQIVFQ